MIADRGARILELEPGGTTGAARAADAARARGAPILACSSAWAGPGAVRAVDVHRSRSRVEGLERGGGHARVRALEHRPGLDDAATIHLVSAGRLAVLSSHLGSRQGGCECAQRAVEVAANDWKVRRALRQDAEPRRAGRGDRSRGPAGVFVDLSACRRQAPGSAGVRICNTRSPRSGRLGGRDRGQGWIERLVRRISRGSARSTHGDRRLGEPR